jgi:hypothetical protein
MSLRPENPVWPVCFGLWASIGIRGAAFGSIPAASLTRLEVIPPTRAQSIVPISPLMFYQLESVKTATGTVSEIVSDGRHK